MDHSAVISDLLSREKTPHFSALWCSSTCSCFNDDAPHNRTLSSFEPVAKIFPSGENVANETRSRILSVAPVILWSVSMVIGWGAWAAQVRPSAVEFINSSTIRDGARDGQP